MDMTVSVLAFRTKQNNMQQTKEHAAAAATQDQQNENLALYNAVRAVPEHALKKIEAGRLKGKSDINPMFRIFCLTREFGQAGFGWYTTVEREWTEVSESGETAVFIDINLYVRRDGEWSKPIRGTGGNKVVSLEKKWENGEQIITQYLDDEAYKKAYTDAISVAAKALGIGADVYWEADKTKYDTHQPEQNQPSVPQVPVSGKPSLSPSTSNWRQAVAFCAKQSDTVDNLRQRILKKYNISDQNLTELLKQAGKTA